MKRRWSIGFGFERLGLLAHRFPVVFTILIAAVTAFSAVNVLKVRFNGDVLAVLSKESEAYRTFVDNRERFRDFSGDLTIIVQSDRLVTAQGLEELRFLQLELAVTEGVANVTTMFSLPLPDPNTGALQQFFPEEIGSDEEAGRLVAQLVERWPQARSLVAPDRNLAVLLVELERMPGASTWTSFVAARDAIEEAAPEDFRLLYAGLTPVGGTIVDGLISDQLRLSLIGLLIGGSIAYFIFRSLVVAFIASAPTALTSLWTLGLFGFFEVPINYLTTVLPTLALIIAFEDSIMLTFQWQGANHRTFDPGPNMEATLRETGPASALTSVTTLLAFVAFAYVSGTALRQFSWLGAASIAIAFLSVIVTVPVAAHWASRLRLVRPGRARMPITGAMAEPVWRLVSKRPVTVASAGLAAVAALSFVHFDIRAEYRITDYLPTTSQVREAEALSNEVLGGRSALLVSVPKAAPGSTLSEPNRLRLAEIEAALGRVVEADRVFSLLQLARGLESRAAIDRLASEIESAGEGGRSGLQSKDGGSMLLTVRIPSNQSIAVTREQVARLKAELAALPYGKDVLVTGFDALMAEEFTSLIDQLRGSLLIEVVLGILVIGIATRSPLLAAAAITPNLLPILCVEFVIWLRGGTVNMSEVIALTIGFGITVGNAVHVINHFAGERMNGASVEEAVAAALRIAGPAVGASMLIICISTLVTQASVMPMIPLLGLLVISSLSVGFLSNIVILPANILVLRRFFADGRHSAGREPGVSETRT